MEVRKHLKFIFILTGITLVPVFVSAYNAETTHPALTKETVELFNYYYPELAFEDKEKALFMLGSTKEDDPELRCLHHFYDPVYGDGLMVGIHLGSNAKEWSQNTTTQMGAMNVAGVGFTKDLFSAESDYSWERVIYDYVHNDKARALEALGHILHLIQDMSVPPHTRNDPHLAGKDDSPYEIYTKRFNKENIKNLSDILKNEKEIIFDNLNKYFDSMASFTNKNFFSKDTVDNEILLRRYTEPVVDFEKKDINTGIVFGYRNLENESFKLIKIDYLYNKFGEIEKTIYKFDDKNDLILQDYWNILSEQAVLHGAGVIKLFFDEVEKEKQTLALLEKNTSGLRKFTKGVKQGFSNTIEVFSKTYVNVNNKVAEIDRMDLVANVGDGVDDFGVEIGGFNPQFQPQNRPIIIESKPEDPNSPELQKLALILREAERMIDRTEKKINNLEGQNVGGSIEYLLITEEKSKTSLSEELILKENELIEVEEDGNEINYLPGYGGGGGGAAATPTSSTTTTSAIISSPQITSPSDLTQTFTSNSIVFSGTASSTQIISTNFSSATTTVNSSDVWHLTLIGLSTGTTTINFYASDSQGNISSSTTITIYVNTFTPDVSLSISQCDNSMLATSCLIATTTLDILWSTTASVSDFDYFNIENNGVFSTTTATSTQIVGLSEGNIYNFSVATVAQNGNISATSTQQVEINTMPIVINEIAWAGTGASTDDEWIELYNRSDEDIDLTDWSIYATDGAPNLNFSSASDKIIEAGTYYLIERSDDTTVNDISADFSTPFSGSGTSNGLNNTGENLVLAYKKSGQATTTIDQAPFGSDWIYKDGTRTLERYDYDLSGNDTNNWNLPVAYSASASLLNGEDANGDRINGTPKARNSINYKISKNGVLDESKTITKANSPYVITGDGLTVSVGKTLTIGEGVVIKFIRSSNSDIIVNGSIQSNGTQAEPVIFTHFYDDEQEDTNGDGVCVSGTNCPGDLNYYWSQIILVTGSSGSEFDNTAFKYGGYRLGTTYPKAMVILDNAQANFDNVTVENSYSSGISLNTSTSTISNSTIQNNYKRQFGDSEDFYGIYALNGQVEVLNSNFDNNQIGIGFFDTLGSSVSDNNFTNHEGFPLVMNGSAGFSLTNNSGSNNDKNGIQVCGAITKVGTNTTLTQNPLPYLVEKSIEVMTGSSLAINSGSVFKFKQYNINVAGELNINGTTGNPVIFTSAYDDSDGTDVYGDGTTATSSISKIGGINLHSATSTIGNAEFRYLDRATAYYDTYGVQSPIYLDGVTYSYNTWSIFADDQTAPVNKNENVQFVGTQSMSSLDNW